MDRLNQQDGCAYVKRSEHRQVQREGHGKAHKKDSHPQTTETLSETNVADY